MELHYENYNIDEFGILHQGSKEEFRKDYGQERNGYGEISNYLSYLRLGFIVGQIENCKSILDIGFGNGDFLRACQNYFGTCAGYE